MKRLDSDYKSRLIRLSAYAQKKKNKRKSSRYVSPRERFINPDERIEAPVTMDLANYQNAKELLRVVRAISNRVLKLGLPVRLDLSGTKQFYVSGAIYLYAELDRVINESNLVKPVTLIRPKASRPCEVMKQIGLFDLCGDDVNITPEREDVIYWRLTKGENQSGELQGRHVEEVTAMANSTAQQLEVNGIWKGINEAVNNVVEHAYRLPRYDNFQGLPNTKWWMLSHIRNNHFVTAVCDLGCGYSKTINKTMPEDFLVKLKGILNIGNEDIFAIKAAMEYGRTSTEQRNRGKGSRDAQSVLLAHGKGELIILSNSGLVKFSMKNGKLQEEFTDDIGLDTGGTILWWRIPLQDEKYETN